MVCLPGWFTDWQKKAGAEDYGFIAVDMQEGKVVKAFKEKDLDLQEAEKQLNEVGYTIGIEVES